MIHLAGASLLLGQTTLLAQGTDVGTEGYGEIIHGNPVVGAGCEDASAT